MKCRHTSRAGGFGGRMPRAQGALAGRGLRRCAGGPTCRARKGGFCVCGDFHRLLAADAPRAQRTCRSGMPPCRLPSHTPRAQGTLGFRRTGYTTRRRPQPRAQETLHENASRGATAAARLAWNPPSRTVSSARSPKRLSPTPFARRFQPRRLPLSPASFALFRRRFLAPLFRFGVRAPIRSCCNRAKGSVVPFAPVSSARFSNTCGSPRAFPLWRTRQARKKGARMPPSARVVCFMPDRGDPFVLRSPAYL